MQILFKVLNIFFLRTVHLLQHTNFMAFSKVLIVSRPFIFKQKSIKNIYMRVQIIKHFIQNQ